jgi:AraC-like DNA-binding protein
MPLLILVIQGGIFSVLLFWRYQKDRKLRDVLLAVLLLILGYHRTTYVIGFMEWYDTYRNTKINYFLVNLLLALGPLIYFYVKSAVNPDFKFRRKDLWHFIPAILYIAYCMVIYFHDSTQPGFEMSQNGAWMESVSMKYVFTLHGYLANISLILYMVFSFQLYYNFRRRIVQYYSNTYKAELNWLRNFLIIFSFTFSFGIISAYTDAEIIELHWTQKWWQHFVSACAMVYLGIYGYFTDLSSLEHVEKIKPVSISANVEVRIDPDLKSKILHVMKEDRPYLDPELTLGSLSKITGIQTQELSAAINNGFGMNFNDFINSYRVDEVKNKMKSGRAGQLSLLGIAYESGFNSKATFNRTFKKFTHQSPSVFLKSLSSS